MINLKRLKRDLENLGQIGFESGKGISRLAFTPKYEEGKNFVKSIMEDVGLEVYEDSVGNLFGKLKGKANEESIIIGSHIDTVPSGGMFDGALGVLGGIECMRTLIENNYKNRHTLEVVAFNAEEGSELGGTFGSRCFGGQIDINEKVIEGLKKVDLSPQDIEEAIRKPSNIKNYLELHIEQGGTLDLENIPIGVVEGIVGIVRYKVTVRGKANHAGTTPMKLRDDALIKASNIIIKLNEIVKEVGGNLVGTVGKIEAFPGAVNVIPGRVEFIIELRDIKREPIEKTMNILKNEIKDEKITIENMIYKDGVYLNKNIKEAIEKASEKLNYRYKNMVSGAGHDANAIAKIAPTGMIFIPSKKGISHSPHEWTEWEDIEKGGNVLLETIKILDNK